MNWSWLQFHFRPSTWVMRSVPSGCVIPVCRKCLTLNPNCWHIWLISCSIMCSLEESSVLDVKSSTKRDLCVAVLTSSVSATGDRCSLNASSRNSALGRSPKFILRNWKNERVSGRSTSKYHQKRRSIFCWYVVCPCQQARNIGLNQ